MRCLTRMYNHHLDSINSEKGGIIFACTKVCLLTVFLYKGLLIGCLPIQRFAYWLPISYWVAISKEEGVI